MYNMNTYNAMRIGIEMLLFKVLFPDFVWRVQMPKILAFGYFVLIWWPSDKTQ